MEKAAKRELEKMFLLMERMDSHYTLSEALEAEEKIETKRDTYTDLDQFINDVNLGASFVGLGYIQGYEGRKIYPTNPDTNQGLGIPAGLGKMDKTSRGYGKINNIVSDPEFSNPTGRVYAKHRSMNSQHFAGVLKITNYVFNWGNSRKYGDFMKDYFKSKEDARSVAGFGKGDSAYQPDDWHRNPMYGGIELSPVSSRDSINGYHQQLDANNSLYGFSDPNKNPIMDTKPDGTQYQKRAFKFGLKNIEKQWAKYCLVDTNGEIDDIDNSLGALLGKLPAEFTDLRKKIVPQMKQDEINFINAISQIEQNQALAKKVWLTDHIMYIVAYDRSQKRYVRYINPNIEIEKFPVNSNDLKNIVNREIKETETVVRYKKSEKPAAE